MSKHTAGPWKASVAFFGPSGNGVPKVSHGDTSSVMCFLNLSGAYGGNKGIERANADARLIAAAPELLEALEDVLSAYRDARTALANHKFIGGHEETPIMQRARAAIAKARGQ